MFNYSEKVIDHFMHPRLQGILTESQIDPATEQLIVADAGHALRGDSLRLTIKLQRADEKILDIRFQNFGTGLPIASASSFCSMVIGKTLTEALKITAEDLDRELDGLPELKARQPVLVLDAFDGAVRRKRGLPPRERGLPGETPLCTCFQVPESVIERAVRLRRLTTVEEITAATKAGGGCHSCHPDLEAILARYKKGIYKQHLAREDYETAHRLYGTPLPDAEELQKNEKLAPVPDRTAKVAADGFVYPDKSPVAAAVRIEEKPRTPQRHWRDLNETERLQRIEEVVERDLRPAIRTDGGDIKLLGLDENRVRVSLHGHCKTCHSALSTLKLGVEKRLQEAVWPELEVEEVFEVEKF